MEMSEGYSSYPILVPESISKNNPENMQYMPPGNAAASLNLMSSQSIVPVSQSTKYIKVTRESQLGSDKNFVFHDNNNQLLYKSTLSQGSFSKCAKCVVQSTNVLASDFMSFDANSKMICNGLWKRAELRNGTGSVIGFLEMRIPLHVDVTYALETGLAVSINNNNGEAIFKIKMLSGPLPYRRRGTLNYGNPYSFEVLSASYGQKSVGKIYCSNTLYNICAPSSTRGYTFEFDLPLDAPTLSMIFCGVMAVETCFTDQERNRKYFIVGGLIFFGCIVLIQIIIYNLVSARHSAEFEDFSRNFQKNQW